MRVSKPLVYCNMAALVINTTIVCLMVVKLFPPVLGIASFIGCLAGAIWCSCYVNGKLPKRPARSTFYEAPTEKAERI